MEKIFNEHGHLINLSIAEKSTETQEKMRELLELARSEGATSVDIATLYYWISQAILFEFDKVARI